MFLFVLLDSVVKAVCLIFIKARFVLFIQSTKQVNHSLNLFNSVKILITFLN